MNKQAAEQRITADIKYGVVLLNTYPVADENGNMQWVTRVNNNGEVAEHQPIRIIYNDQPR